MNDTTLPITKKKSNTRQRSNGNGGRVKKGFGLHDWMSLLRHAKDLAQRKGMQYSVYKVKKCAYDVHKLFYAHYISYATLHIYQEHQYEKTLPYQKYNNILNHMMDG